MFADPFRVPNHFFFFTYIELKGGWREGTFEKIIVINTENVHRIAITAPTT